MTDLWNQLTDFLGTTWHNITVFLLSGTDPAYLAWAGIGIVFVVSIPQLLMLREILAEFIEGDVLSLIAFVVMLLFFPIIIMVGVLVVLVIIISWVTAGWSTQNDKKL